MFCCLHRITSAKAITGPLLLSLLAMLLQGCQAAAFLPLPPEQVEPSYKGLQKQSAGIMVWADTGTAMDYPTVQIDLARSVQAKLQQAIDSRIDDVKELKLVKSETIRQFQENHPELEGEDVAAIAPKLPGVTRLIYIEITGLSLHPADAVDLSRGSVAANLRVYEVSGDKAVSKFRENNVQVVYPTKGPPEGVSGLDDSDVYRHSIDELGKAIAMRFVTHEVDAE